MKTNVQNIFACIIASIIMLMGCSKTDPMDLVMNGSTIDQFGESMLNITKAMKDSFEREDFSAALDEVAFGPKTLLEHKMSGGFIVGLPSDQKLLTRLANKCHGKTVREILAMAEREKEVKKELALQIQVKGRVTERPESYNFLIKHNEIYLFPKKKTDFPRGKLSVNWGRPCFYAFIAEPMESIKG